MFPPEPGLLSMTKFQRVYETAVLKTLGAKRKTILLILLAEYGLMGAVAGIVGAGGNVGAVLAGFLMKGTGDVRQTLLILGGAVLVSAICAIGVCFSLAVPETPAPAAA